MNNKELTQHYSTWGGKLLQHCDVLHELQRNKSIHPITVQIAPTEACDSDCPFCSVANRPMGSISWDDVISGLNQFRTLGAKSLEITGGGNPMLYRNSGATINEVVHAAHYLGYKIGIITNSENIPKYLSEKSLSEVQWIRVSLAKLDEGKTPEDYKFEGVGDKLSLSYIYHSRSGDVFQKIADVVGRWPLCKFVRIAADCTTDDSVEIEEKVGSLVRKHDPSGKWFIKDIGQNYRPFQGGCWQGGIRPYWTSTGIYICTSHVLKTRNYEPEWRLCSVKDITKTWERMCERIRIGMKPYDIDIANKCWHCYYGNNNELLYYVATELPDKDFA